MDRTPASRQSGPWLFGQRLSSFCRAWLIGMLLLGLGSYFFVSREVVASQPVQIPVEELPHEAV